MSAPADSPARLWPYLLANAVAAVWIDFGRIHELFNPDSAVYSLASLYEWRPFFWEQDRVGLLWPLLFSWCHDPLAVLLLQTGTTTFLGLCLPVVFACVLTPHRAAPAVATAASAAVLCFGSPLVLDNWLVVCNYPGSLTLGLTAVLLLDRRGGGWGRWVGRVAVAWVLLLAAHWLYVGVALFLVPFAVYRGWLPGLTPSRVWWRAVFRPLFDHGVVLTVLGSSVAVGAVAGLMEYVRQTDPTVVVLAPAPLPPEQWREGYFGFYDRLSLEPGTTELAALFGVATGLGVLWGLIRNRRTLAAVAVRGVPALIAAGGEVAFLGTRYWVKHNDSHPRYLIAALTGVGLAALLAGLVPAFGRRAGRWAGWVAVGLLFVAATARFGWPGPDVPGRVIAEVTEDHADEFTAAGVDGIGGDYWRVWPAVFHLNAVRHARGERELAWGLTERSGPWAHRWQSEPGRVFRVGVPRSADPTAGDQLACADDYAEKYGLVRVGGPVAEVGRVRVYEYMAVGP